MATIRSILQIQDNMSKAFQPITNSLNILISGFESLATASDNVIDTASLEAARRELNRAETAFNEIEQEIRQAERAQDQLNNEIRAGTGAANDFLGKLAAIAGAYLSLQSMGDIIRVSDEMTNIEARLNLVVDSLPSVDNLSADVALNADAGGLNQVEQLQQQIFDAAQRSLAPYDQTADLVGKIGMNAKDAFSNTSEVVAFAELLNKQFGIAGTNAEGVSSATLQLIQALGSGVLRGEELNSVFEAAPNIIHTIADYLGEPIGRIRELAAEGQLSADVVKNAMFASADSINNKFNSMPFTFEQIWTEFRNNALWAFKDVLKEINNVANGERFAEMRESAAQALHMLAAVASHAFSLITSVGAFLYDQWSWLGPIILGVGGAILTFSAYLGIVKMATMAVTVAQWYWNAAMAANPIGLVIAGIVLLIGLFYAAIAVINHFAGTSISATGLIAGAFMVLATFIYNRIAFLWNIFAAIAEFFVNVWNHPMYAVKKLFYDLASNVLDQAIAMTSGWDGFATSFVNAMISAVNGAIRAWNWFVDMLPDEVATTVGISKASEFSHRTSVTSDLQDIKGALGDWVGQAPADAWEAPKMELKSLGAAWDTGYNWGENLFDFSKEESKNEDPYKDILDAMKGIQGGLDDVAGAGKDTAGNTAKMADTIDASQEDLKYLRDAANANVENRYITQQIKVDARSANTVNSELDLDGIIGQFVTKTEEAIQTVGEGV